MKTAGRWGATGSPNPEPKASAVTASGFLSHSEFLSQEGHNQKETGNNLIAGEHLVIGLQHRGLDSLSVIN